MRVEAHKPVGDLMSLIRNSQEKLTYDYPTFTTRQIESPRKKICFCSLILVRLTMDKQGEFFDTTEQGQTTSSAIQFRRSIENRLSRRRTQHSNYVHSGSGENNVDTSIRHGRSRL